MEEAAAEAEAVRRRRRRRRWRWWRREWRRPLRAAGDILVGIVDDRGQDVPGTHSIFAAPPDQCLVLLAKIETQAAPHAFETSGADAPFHKGRRHYPATKREPQFRTKRKCVLAAQIAVANVSLPVVSHVVLQIDLIHEACFHVVALREHNRVDGPEMPIAGGVTLVVVLKVEAELPNSAPTMPLRVHRPQYASNSPAA